MKKVYLYIAGPINTTTYGESSQMSNVRTSIMFARTLRSFSNDSVVPFLPQLSSFWDLVLPATNQYWMTLDFDWISFLHGLIRLPGKSKGADEEVEYAKKLKKPVWVCDPLIDLNAEVYRITQWVKTLVIA
jgi:hypothetical protein